jgi:hypothetical protein
VNIKTFLAWFIVAASVSGLVACRKAGGEPAHEKRAEASAEKESKPAKNENGESLVTLDQETQKRIALKTERLVATNLTREIKAYGRVLDPASLVEIAGDLEASRVAAQASRQEYERLKSLADNTSVKALQAAEASARRDELAEQALQRKLKLTWGNAIAGRKDFAALVEGLVAAEHVLIRLELPVGETIPESSSMARVGTLSSPDTIQAEILEPAPRMDEQTQGQTFLAITRAKFSGLVPGASAVGYLAAGAAQDKGVIVPRAAVVRHDGSAWIFLKTGETKFSRREIVLEIPTEGGWLVSNLSATDEVVVGGAQTLLSEESKSQLQSP